MKPAFAICLALALFTSPYAIVGQEPAKENKSDRPPLWPKEENFKGVITGLQQEPSHVLLMRKGLTYTIMLHSPGIITSGQLKNNEGHKLLSFRGAGVFKSPEDGAYRLTVTSPGGSSGQYQVILREAHLTETKPGEVFNVGKDGLTIEAVLSKDDPLDKAPKKSLVKETKFKGPSKGPRPKAHCRTYDVQMTGGKTYIIDHSSRQFDAYLRLENSAGEELAIDDDSGGKNDARIRFKAPSDGVYRVVATSFGMGEGLFVLKIREQ